MSLAVPLLAIRLTDDLFIISLASVASMLPSILLSVPIGAVTDRVDRAKVMAGANLLRAGILLVTTVAVSASTIGIPLLNTAVVILAVLELLSDTSASSLVPPAAGRQNLERAHSWMQGGQLVVQSFVAVSLAGILFAPIAWGPFAVTSGAYAVAVLAAVALRKALVAPSPDADQSAAIVEGRKRPPVATSSSYLASISEGWAFILHHRALCYLIVTGACLAGAVELSRATVTLYLVEELQVPVGLVGLLSTGSAVGGLVEMRISIPLSARRGRRFPVVTGTSLLIVGMLLAYFAPDGALAAVALLIMSYVAALWNVATDVAPDKALVVSSVNFGRSIIRPK